MGVRRRATRVPLVRRPVLERDLLVDARANCIPPSYCWHAPRRASSSVGKGVALIALVEYRHPEPLSSLRERDRRAMETVQELLDGKLPTVAVAGEVPGDGADLVGVARVGEEIAEDLPNVGLVEHRGLHSLQLDERPVNDDVRVSATQGVTQVEGWVEYDVAPFDDVAVRLDEGTCECRNIGGDPVVGESEELIERRVRVDVQERMIVDPP